MSYQNYTQNPKTYNDQASDMTGVPSSYSSNSDIRMLPSTTTIKTVPSTSGTQNQNGMLLFQIPASSGAGYLRSSSMYLQLDVTVVSVAAAASFWCFNNGTTTGAPVGASVQPGGASAIINRINVSVGGTLISSINNYDKLASLIYNHACSESYTRNDAAIYEGYGQCYLATGAGGDAGRELTRQFQIPLLSSCFNSESIPLFLLNSPIVVEILLNGLGAIAGSAGAGVVTAWNVSNCNLVYETCNFDSSYENEMKKKLMDGALYKISTSEFYNLQISEATAINYNLGLSLSSVKSCFFTSQPTYVADQIQGFNGPAAISKIQLFIDSRLINNNSMTSYSAQYMELQRALGGMFDYSTSSNNGSRIPVVGDHQRTSATNFGNYNGGNYFGGVSCQRSSDGGYIMSGTPCMTLQFSRQATAVTAGVFYIMIAYSQILLIDSSGSVSLVR